MGLKGKNNILYAKIRQNHTKGEKMNALVQFRMDSEDKDVLEAMLKDLWE